MQSYQQRVLDLLAPFSASIRGRDPMGHRIPFDPERWRLVPREADQRLVPLVDRFPDARVGRSDLIELGSAAMQNPDDSIAARRVLLASLMFGWGKTRGMGPKNGALALADPRLEVSLRGCVESLRNGNSLTAYRNLQIAGCGPAMMSKVLYALGRSSIPRYPLILDSLVAATLDRLMGTPVAKRFVFIDYQLRRDPPGYIRFVEQTHEWAAQLGCEADQLEMFLWKPDRELIDAAVALYD